MHPATQETLRSARLLGRDHARVGAVAAVAEGRAAIVLSAGGARKTYDHTDANEDAVGFATGPGGALVVAADAHLGATSSEFGVGHLLDACAPAWLQGPGPATEAWPEVALAALWDAHMAIRRACQRPDRQGSRTTLAAALIRPAEGRLLVASVGDSHIFRVAADGAVDLAEAGRPCAPRFFLGAESLTRDELAEAAAVVSSSTDGALAVALATDGLSEKNVGVSDPAAAVSEAVHASAGAVPDLRPLEAARAIAERANAAHLANPSGDNVGVAVVWLQGAG